MAEICTINPATDEIIARYPIMHQDEVDQIINATHQAQLAWENTAISQRTKYISNAATNLRDEKKRYAELITTEMGKPITQSQAEIEKCAKLCDYYAKMTEQFLQPEIVQTELYKTYRAYKPIGTIFAIMPWNFPFWQVMRFAVPNLMLGNAGILKHAPTSMGVAMEIENMFSKAGFPTNLFRSLVVDVDQASYIIHHPHIAGVTLTGSNTAGKSVAIAAGSALKKLVLELGGSDPYVILEDADLELAAEQCVLSRLSNAGQVCIAAKRMIVVEKVREKFQELVIAKAKTYTVGNPQESSTKLGPMARTDLRDKIHEQVQRSIQEGARCVLGGVLPQGKGFYYPATVLLDVGPESPAFHEELFGPVIAIVTAKDEKHAIELANQTKFGLAAAVFTRDLNKGEEIARDKIIAGTCAVNVLVASDPRLPFGGIKQSGYGRELAIEGMREFANIKTIMISK